MGRQDITVSEYLNVKNNFVGENEESSFQNVIIYSNNDLLTVRVEFAEVKEITRDRMCYEYLEFTF